MKKKMFSFFSSVKAAKASFQNNAILAGTFYVSGDIL